MILNKLKEIWEKNPDWRLGQLLVNGLRQSTTRIETSAHVFFSEDHVLLRGLEYLADGRFGADPDKIDPPAPDLSPEAILKMISFQDVWIVSIVLVRNRPSGVETANQVSYRIGAKSEDEAVGSVIRSCHSQLMAGWNISSVTATEISGEHLTKIIQRVD